MSSTLFSPEKPPHRQTCTAVLTALEVDGKAGLSSEQTGQRLERYGANELPQPPSDPKWKKFIAQFKDPLTVLLLIATVIS
ncbi:hypothetical protein GX408_04270, partial [bacterium]|nr:hypothetical protein [bacterium]